MTAINLRTVDSKGRITIGVEYAGRTVRIEKRGGEMVVTPCRVVPEREAWLWENKEAFRLAHTGIDQAQHGKLDDGPDFGKAQQFIDGPEDRNE